MPRELISKSVQSSGACRASDLALTLLVAAGMLLAFYVLPLFFGTALFDPDEGLHAAIAQEMLERGDWLMPRFLGEPFFDKPPLYFWCQAASLAVFGMNEAAIRLPGLVFGLLGAVTTALVAWRLYDRDTGLLAGFFQTTLILPLAIAQAAVHDVALVPLTNLAILAFWDALHAPTRRRQLSGAMLAGVALGLACLTKGLLGAACVFVAIGGYSLISRSTRLTHVLVVTLAIAVAAFVAAPWYWLMELRNPGYAHYYFVERHLLGFFTRTQEHGHAAWWYYLPVMLGGGLPWIAYLPGVIADARRAPDGSTTREANRFLCVWFFGYLLLLCMAGSKLVTYLLPVFPPLAALVAAAWVRHSRGQASASASRWLETTFRISATGSPALLPIAMAVTAWRFQVEYSWFAYVLAPLAACACWLPLWRRKQDDLATTMRLAGVAFAANFLLIMALVVPPIGDAMSARGLARYLNERGSLPPTLFVPDERNGSLVFYLTPELRRELEPGQIVRCKLDDWWQALPGKPGSLIALRDDRRRRAVAAFGIERVSYEQAGQFAIYDAHQVRAAMRAASDIVADQRGNR